MNSATARAMLLSGLVLLSGCDKPCYDAPILHAEPFIQLQQIQLGMSARELKALRPDVRPEDYTGFIERVGDHTIQYGVDGLMTEGQTPSGRSTIRSILVVDTLSGANPDSAFASQFRRLRIAGAKCYRVAGGVISYVLAVSPHEGFAEYLIVHVVRDLTSGSIEQAQEIYGASLDNPKEKAWAARAAEEPCPRPGG